MRLAAFDSETHLIKPGMMAPRLVCVSYADEKDTLLFDRIRGLKLMRHAFMQPDLTLIAHNASYDLGVLAAEEVSLLPLIFDALRDGRIVDTIVRQMLLDVALGMRKFRRVDGVVSKATYALGDLVKLYYNEHLEKIDTWRLRYAFLDGVPVEEWPPEARDYAILDAVQARRLYLTQEDEIKECFGELPNQAEQQRAAWALHLMSMWGVRAEAAAVDRFIAGCEEQIAIMRTRLLATCERCGALEDDHDDAYCEKQPRDADDIGPAGFKPTGILKPDASRTMAEIRRRVVKSLEQQQIAVPMTDPSGRFPEGQVSTDRDTLQMTDDPALHVLAESMTYSKHLDQWGPVLRAAVERPCCARYNVLVETGRTSCSGGGGQEGTNFQNPPRKGDVRPAIVPRKGWLFCSTDADTIELRAHAQNCLELVGWSRMAEALVDQHKNGGPDLHTRLAAALVGADALELNAARKAGDKDANDARQFAKIPNFGFPGGLGAETFVAFAAAQLSPEQHKQWFGLTRDKQIASAARHRETWFATWPENRDYFRVVGNMINREKGYGTIRQLMSGRIRGEVRFTSAANGFFQGRVADAMKEILWRLADECYTGRLTHVDGSISSARSPLYGSRPAMFLHDEPLVEMPEDAYTHERAARQQQIMIETLNKWMPSVPCTSSAVLMRRWFKGAEPLFVDGRLVPSKPDKVYKDGKVIKVRWVHDPGEELAA